MARQYKPKHKVAPEPTWRAASANRKDQEQSRAKHNRFVILRRLCWFPQGQTLDTLHSIIAPCQTVGKPIGIGVTRDLLADLVFDGFARVDGDRWHATDEGVEYVKGLV